jgi:hypothetical protein
LIDGYGIRILHMFQMGSVLSPTLGSTCWSLLTHWLVSESSVGKSLSWLTGWLTMSMKQWLTTNEDSRQASMLYHGLISICHSSEHRKSCFITWMGHRRQFNEISNISNQAFHSWYCLLCIGLSIIAIRNCNMSKL